MKEWQLQDAKSRFSELVREASSAPQIVTKQGNPEVVVISYEEWESRFRSGKSLVEFMASAPKLDIEFTRDTSTDREVEL